MTKDERIAELEAENGRLRKELDDWVPQAPPLDRDYIAWKLEQLRKMNPKAEYEPRAKKEG